MGKSGKRKKPFSFPDIFRLCKGKGNADDDRHAYQKQPLHNHERRSDRERRNNAGIEEHSELKEYRKPHDIESKRDVKNDAPNSQYILYGNTQNKFDYDTTRVTKVHVEPLNRNGAIKAYMIDTPDARVDFPKEVPDDKVDCANSFEDIPFIDADDENSDQFQKSSIAEMGIKEKHEDQVQDVQVHEIQGWTVIEKVPTTNEVGNKKTLNSDNECVAFMDTKTKIDDLNTNTETEEIVSIEQAESALNIQDVIGDPISEPDVSYTTIVVKNEIQDQEKFKETVSRDVEIVESTTDVVLPLACTINEDDVDGESVVIVENIDDLVAEGDQSLNKGSNLESSSQIDNENTEDHHEPDTHDIDSNSHLITYALNEGSNVETFSEIDNDNFDNVTNGQDTYYVISKPDQVTETDSDKESGNEQEEGRNTNNDEIQVNKNTKQIYHNSFDDDDDTQHTYKNDDDNDSDFESGQEPFQDTLNWHDQGGAASGHSLSKVFKADQNEFRPNLEVEDWNNKLDFLEPTHFETRTDDGVKTPLKKEPPEIALPDKSDNVLFYQNKIKSRPTIGYTIEDMLKWMGDYAFLEKNHSYIQWLFPIPGSSGMNYQAQALQDHEIEIMKNDEEIQGRVIRSFRMMLDFYGMEMVDDTFQRNERNWQARYNHLNQSFHNRMRITRIIQSLGELGFTKIQTRWLSFLMQEAMVNKSLNRLGGDSMQYFIDAIKEDDDRHKLYEKYFRYMMGDFSEPRDNDDGNNGETGDNINGDTDDNTNIESDDNTNEKTDEDTNVGTGNNTNDKNVDCRSNDNVDDKSNANGDVSNGCDSGETDVVNANVMQDMSADDDKTEKDRSGSIMSSESADNDISDNYSTAEEETDHELNVDHNIPETIDHVYESMETVEYGDGLSNNAQNSVSLAPDATSDTSGDTILTNLDNSQSYYTDAGTTETKKNDKTQEEEKRAIDREKFEIQSISFYDDDDTDIITSDMKDDTKDSDTDSESNDKTVDTITRNDSFKDKDDSVYETKVEDADIDSDTELDDSNKYFVFHSIDGTIKH